HLLRRLQGAQDHRAPVQGIPPAGLLWHLCGAPSCRAFCEDVVTGRLPKDTVCPQLKKDN
ncbi:MAG: hypothetical protein IJC01_01440, partial [Clostridia bacterium]|nr:hypothetical protein [Clostridia bacterium]